MSHISAGYQSPAATTISTSTHTTVLSTTSPNRQLHSHAVAHHPGSGSASGVSPAHSQMSLNDSILSETSPGGGNCSLNYSPKHSRKISSLTANRNINMKNLSLNLVETATLSAPPGSATTTSSSNRTANPAAALHANGGAGGSGTLSSLLNGENSSNDSLDIPYQLQPPRLARRKTLTLTIPSESVEPPLVTPAVTRTPQMPPAMRAQTLDSYSTPNLNGPQTGSGSGSAGSTFSAFHDSNPFREGIPQQTNLQSPFLMNNSRMADTSLDGSQLADEFSGLQIRPTDFQAPASFSAIPPPPLSGIASGHNSNGHEPLGLKSSSPLKAVTSASAVHANPKGNGTYNDNINEHNVSSDNSLIKPQTYENINNQSINSTGVRRIPEELQESSQLEAYPTGPANVLNDSIFLFSDPDPLSEISISRDHDFGCGTIDINDYDLVINVARECRDLSKEFDTKNGTKEYIQIQWSHTSSISKELPNLVNKIAKFDDSDKPKSEKKRKILIHCQCGVSRSACVIVGYFMYKFKAGVNEAYELLKTGSDDTTQEFTRSIKERGYTIDACNRICPNMSLIFELMEFGDSLRGPLIY